MQPVLLLLGAAAVSLAGVAIRLFAVARERSERTRAWQAALRAVNLEDVTQDAGGSGAVAGFLGEHRVFLEEHSAGEGEIAVRIVIQGDSQLTLGRETLRAALEADLGARELEIGDAAFDQEFCVRGSPGVARALLDAKARERLTPLLRGWIRLDGIPTLGVEGHSVAPGR